MLKVTTAAMTRLSTKLARKQTTDDSTLRFSRKPGGWKLHLDDPRPADETFVHEGKKILVLDEETSAAMSDWLLDVHDTDAGPRLRLTEPSTSGS